MGEHGGCVLPCLLPGPSLKTQEQPPNVGDPGNTYQYQFVRPQRSIHINRDAHDFSVIDKVRLGVPCMDSVGGSGQGFWTAPGITSSDGEIDEAPQRGESSSDREPRGTCEPIRKSSSFLLMGVDESTDVDLHLFLQDEVAELLCTPLFWVSETG